MTIRSVLVLSFLASFAFSAGCADGGGSDPADASVMLDGSEELDADINDPPSIAGVTLAPADPLTGDGLVATPGAVSDPDGDTVTLTYGWRVDGVVAVGQTSATLPASETERGEVWEVTVTPNDGTIDGTPVTAMVIIGNTPPLVNTVTIAPTNPSRLDTLSALIEAVDDDGDTPTYSYAWTVDGVPAGSEPTLAASGLTPGASVQVTVIPSDGTVGAAVPSATVTIVDLAPSVDSVTVEPASPREADTLTASVVVSDVESDPVTLSYEWRVNDAVVATTESITGALFAKGDSVTVTVTPNDGFVDGMSVTSAVTTIANTAPVGGSVVIAPSPATTASALSASVTGVTDADGDMLTFSHTWFVDDVQAGTGPTLPATAFARGQDVRVEVVPSDGDDAGATLTSPTVTVVNAAPTVTASLPIAPTAGVDPIRCAVVFDDSDGDMVNLLITWTEDGGAYTGPLGSDTIADDTLPASVTHSGRTYECQVAFDDGNGGTGSTSASVAVDRLDLILTVDTTLAAGNYTFGSVVVPVGITLTTQGLVNIDANVFDIQGTVSGVGEGSAAGLTSSAGSGSGGGGTSTNSGAGGGSYGGVGGTGGFDAGDTPGTGGPTYGSATDQTIELGSGGGSTDSTPGGAGGGALIVRAGSISVSGTINMSGADGAAPGNARGGGGGSGGGILLIGGTVSLSGMLLANGGVGSAGTSTANDSGGGGGGGRVKVFHVGALVNSATLSAVGGLGGPFGSTAAGQTGAAGTVHIEEVL